MSLSNDWVNALNNLCDNASDEGLDEAVNVLTGHARFIEAIQRKAGGGVAPPPTATLEDSPASSSTSKRGRGSVKTSGGEFHWGAGSDFGKLCYMVNGQKQFGLRPSSKVKGKLGKRNNFTVKGNTTYNLKDGVLTVKHPKHGTVKGNF